MEKPINTEIEIDHRFVNLDLQILTLSFLKKNTLIGYAIFFCITYPVSKLIWRDDY